MNKVCCTVFLVVVEFLWMLRVCRGDSQVFCIFMERCILPCSFHGSSEAVVHWFKTEGDLRVHSYYTERDQLAIQNQHFRSRTSLFKDQISRGNASLQLTGVNVQDEGRYKCYTSTIGGNTEVFIILSVDAPVRKINLQQVGQRITCSSEGIYPKPELTWSTSPPSSITNITVRPTEQQLYNISSSLMLPNNDTDLSYSCAVNTRRNSKRATFRQQGLVTESQSETIIHCSPLNTSLTNLIWRFNHSQIILTQTEPDSQYTVSEEWKQHVKDVSESGSLTLQDLSSAQEGTYTCELGDAVETKITNVPVKINKGNSPNVGAIVGVVIAVLVLSVGAGLVLSSKKMSPCE